MIEEKIASLERAVRYGLENGKRSVIVDLDVLSVILSDSRQLRDREARTCKHLDNSLPPQLHLPLGVDRDAIPDVIGMDITYMEFEQTGIKPMYRHQLNPKLLDGEQ